MKRFYRWSLHFLTLGVTATGVVYFWMKHLLESQDPFSIINHPWQNLMLHGHILFSPLLLFVFGVFFNSHVVRQLRSGQKRGRFSGMVSLLLFPLMAISGYALQIITQQGALQAALVIHLASGGLFALVYVVHLAVGLRAWRATRQPRKPVPRRVRATAALSLALPGLLALTFETSQAGEAALVRVERQVYLMGTRCRLAAAAEDRQTALEGLEVLIDLVEETESQLSTWRPQSRLSQLNRQPLSRPLTLDKDLCRLVSRLQHWHRETEGAFDPAIGRLIEAWDIRGSGRIAAAPEREAALRNSGLQHLFFKPADCSTTRLRDLRLDAGAFGKGEALDRAFERFSSTASPPRDSSKLSQPEEDPLPPPSSPGLNGWMADMGGQIGVWVPAQGQAWKILVAHPRHRDRPLLELELSHGSLAVSGGSERDLMVEGRPVSHIIDPRDGEPAAFRGSTVVWHPSGLASDALSTALYVMGPDGGLKWAQEHRIAACFLIPHDTDDRVERLCTRRFEKRFAASLTETLATAR